MLTIGSFAFASPWILLALLALPLLWFLLRVTPPSPRRQSFPAIRLLFGLRPPEETSARTPWWLMLLRLLIAALVILALAQPLLNPAAPLDGEGPMVLVVDDGWAAARDWEARRQTAEQLLDQAERERRGVVLLTTAPDEAAQARRQSEGLVQDAVQVRQGLDVLMPKPWPVDRRAAASELEELRLQESTQVFWLSNGLDAPGTGSLVRQMDRLGATTVFRSAEEDLPHVLLPPENDGGDLLVRARRVVEGFPEQLIVRAVDWEGYEVGEVPLQFEAESREATGRLRLPLELRNRIERLSIEREQGAAATALIDERWRRRAVGLLMPNGGETAQPLLDEVYYLERALNPFTELYSGDLQELLNRRPAVIVLADAVVTEATQDEALRQWVAEGGMLLRFAGPRMLEEGEDQLLPVQLRPGGRRLGGTLAWDNPAGMASFPESSPFAGLAVPDDILVEQQVLAEPALDLPDKTWARLEDGTPLVTAVPQGQGWTVLVHTTASAEWSNLALSGLFVEMLQRLVAMSQGVAGPPGENLPPLQLLDGFGRLSAPTSQARPLPTAASEADLLGPDHPPGFYGSEHSRRALNLGSALNDLRTLPADISGLQMRPYRMEQEQSLLPWLLTAALLLALLDLLLGLFMRGLMPRRLGANRRSVAAFLFGAVLALGAADAQAQGERSGEAFALSSLEETKLAYVMTGQPDVDELSAAGLRGLSQMLVRRTTVEPADPVGLRPGRDPLAFFPLIYWPITPGQRALDAAEVSALNEFIDNGGTLLIDLRNPEALRGGVYGGADLRRLTEGLDIPPMKPVPPDHVLTKAFYLLQEFPGRYSGSGLWVEETEQRRHDGVATVILGANDWAAAWAVDEMGRPVAAVVPGGERQREVAYRFGINLVMYALTGNYKADQVHVPFILERLGQ